MKVENNETIKNYLNEVTSYIKNKDAHDEVKLEVQSHILDIYYELMENNNNEKDSINKAISRMGNSKDLGIQLNKVHKASPDYITIALIIGIIAIGIMSTVSLLYNDLISTNTMIMNLLSLIIGTIIAIMIYFFDYRKIKNYSYKFYFITLFLTVSIVVIDSLNGFVVNGSLMLSSRFSLLITMSFLISLTSIIHNLNLSKVKNIAILGGLAFIPVVFQLIIPRLTLSIFYIFTLGIVILRNINWRKHIVPTITSSIAIIMTVGVFIMKNPYRLQRLISGMPLIFRVADEELGGSYLQLQSMKILSHSSILGKGFDKNILNTVPISELSNNLVFTYIVSSFGWLLAVISIVLIMSFLVRNFTISHKVKNRFGQDIVLLIIIMLGFQFILTILYSIGASAFTYGIPFISIGSINTLTNCMLIGILSSVYRRRNYSNFNTITIN